MVDEVRCGDDVGNRLVVQLQRGLVTSRGSKLYILCILFPISFKLRFGQDPLSFWKTQFDKNIVNWKPCACTDMAA